MFAKFLKMIHGVSDPPSIAAEQQRQFICETELSMDEIQASAAAGTLEPWRVDRDFFQWYRRVDRLPEIHAFDAGNDDGSDEIEMYEPSTSAVDAVRNFHLRQAERKLRERHNAFPMADAFDSEDSDDDE
jgi:hypothetical protein